MTKHDSLYMLIYCIIFTNKCIIETSCEKCRLYYKKDEDYLGDCICIGKDYLLKYLDIDLWNKVCEGKVGKCSKCAFWDEFDSDNCCKISKAFIKMCGNKPNKEVDR